MSDSCPQIIVISAMSRDRVIGRGDGMPWHLPEEYQHFLDTTQGKTIIIGRRSFEIFGSTLTSANCYVVTRGQREFPNAIAVGSFEHALQLATHHDADIFVAGGASIYRHAVAKAHSMQLSYIAGDFEGDAFFPEFDEDDWRILRREDRGRYEFVEYVR